jgi:hypothetical protein
VVGEQSEVEKPGSDKNVRESGENRKIVDDGKGGDCEELVLGEIGVVASDGDEVVEVIDDNNNNSTSEEPSESGSGSGGALKRKKGSDSDNLMSNSCDGSGTSSSLAKSYCPDKELPKSVSLPKMGSPTSRVLTGDISVESFIESLAGSVLKKISEEKEKMPSAGSTPLKMIGTDLSLAGSEVHDLEEIPLSSSKVQSWRSIAVAVKESTEYDLFISFGVEDVQLAKKKHIKAFNLYSVRPTSGDLYEMRIPMHQEVQLKFKTEVDGRGIRGLLRL